MQPLVVTEEDEEYVKSSPFAQAVLAVFNAARDDD